MVLLLLVNISRESTSVMIRSTLLREAEGFSETLVHMYHTTWHDIPEDYSLNSGYTDVYFHITYTFSWHGPYIFCQYLIHHRMVLSIDQC